MTRLATKQSTIKLVRHQNAKNTYKQRDCLLMHMQHLKRKYTWNHPQRHWYEQTPRGVGAYSYKVGLLNFKCRLLELHLQYLWTVAVHITEYNCISTIIQVYLKIEHSGKLTVTKFLVTKSGWWWAMLNAKLRYGMSFHCNFWSIERARMRLMRLRQYL